jgi:hypothetical protein
MLATISDFFRRKPDQPTERVNVLVVITTHGGTISRDIDMVTSKFISSVDLIKADMALEGTSCYIVSNKDLITPLSIIEGDFYQSNPGYDPVELAEACAKYSKDEQLVLHPDNKELVTALLKTSDIAETNFRKYKYQYANTGRILHTESRKPISNKMYEISYGEFISYGIPYNLNKVTVSFNGKTLDILSSDTGGVGEFLYKHGIFENPRYDGDNMIDFKSVSFQLKHIMDFLSKRDKNFLVRHGLLKPHQMVGSVTMVDMSCSGTLEYETDRHVRGLRYGMNRLSSFQAQSREERSRSRDESDEKPRYKKTGQSGQSGLSTINGGKSRGRKSRGRKSRGRKSHGRKSHGRKSRGRKSRGRKSRGRKSRGRKSRRRKSRRRK